MNPSPQIIINGKFLAQELTGVQRYARGLTDALLKRYPEARVLAPSDAKADEDERILRSPSSKGFRWEQFTLPRLMRKYPDAILVNLANSGPVRFRRQIVTVHDLAFLKDRTWFRSPFRWWYRYLIPRLCRRALAVVTVSEFIQKEVCATYHLQEKKVQVVPNGLPAMDFLPERPVDDPYLLMVGIQNPRKNARFVLNQQDEIHKMGLHILGLRGAGRIYGSTNFKENRHFHIFSGVDDRSYYTFLKHAEALAFPSPYEGFGIPILEALVLGTPVLVPDLPSYRTSFGEGPLYYKEGDAGDFIARLNEARVQKTSTKGESNLKIKYNFEHSSGILADVINISRHENK